MLINIQKNSKLPYCCCQDEWQGSQAGPRAWMFSAGKTMFSHFHPQSLVLSISLPSLQIDWKYIKIVYMRSYTVSNFAFN